MEKLKGSASASAQLTMNVYRSTKTEESKTDNIQMAKAKQEAGADAC